MELSDHTRTLLSALEVSDVARVSTYIAVLLVTAAGLHIAALRSRRRAAVPSGEVALESANRPTDQEHRAEVPNRMPRSKDDPEAVDGYLAALPDQERKTLEELRQFIKASVPDVQERISYGGAVIFAVRPDLVGFAAQQNHLSFFTMSPQLAKAMKDEITKTHKVSGATIHFSADQPLPGALVEKIIRARLEEQSKQ